jgi:hypothetical protein
MSGLVAVSSKEDTVEAALSNHDLLLRVNPFRKSRI